jgi:molybdopterin synthase sulfur carrier subunit
MATVWIPSTACDLTSGKSKVEVDGETVSEVIRNLDLIHPGISSVLIQDNSLRPGYVIAVDGTISSRQLLQAVQPDSEIHFIPAIFGG